jgi:hypothetical protein
MSAAATMNRSCARSRAGNLTLGPKAAIGRAMLEAGFISRLSSAIGYGAPVVRRPVASQIAIPDRRKGYNLRYGRL